MAPIGGDAASSTMLEAYLGGSSSTFCKGPPAPPPRGYSVLSPRRERIIVNQHQHQPGNYSAVDSLLSGRWIPPKAPPKARSEAQSSSSVLSQHLRRPPVPHGTKRRGRSCPRGNAACVDRSVDCSASQCGTESDISEGYSHQLGNNSCQGSVLSHATTPSWRSRSFPPHYRAPGAAPKADGSKDKVEPQAGPQKHRLPPLPSEARGPKGPSSEVRYLGCIASEVNEANAMLADSFIGAKRRPDSDASYQGSFAGGGSRLQAGLSAIPEGQSQCGSYEPGAHLMVTDDDQQSRVYSYRTKSEVGANGEKHVHHYHVLHHYHGSSSQAKS